MFSVGLFYTSLGVLLALFAIKSHERQAGIYFASFRERLDDATYKLLKWAYLQCSPEALWSLFKIIFARVAHVGARGMARIAKVLEHRARHVAHRTSHHRIKRQPHYLEGMLEERSSRETQSSQF